MEVISKTELNEIMQSYGFETLVFDCFRQVEPDTALYFLHDEKNARYCLVAADYLRDDAKLPCDFVYDYYPDNTVKFRAIKQFSYVKNATKKADEYIDDEKHRTMASTGDVCLLFAIDNLDLAR